MVLLTIRNLKIHEIVMPVEIENSAARPNNISARLILAAGLLLWAALVACIGEIRHIHWVLVTSVWGLCPGLSRAPIPPDPPVFFYIWGPLVISFLLSTLMLTLIKN